ncbi:MAG: hypothetical protein JSV78_03850 [Phycisphaerales bacterium]|nr:MAG: hypothetical protein JSV78_03850 [Phycisphaerales bacterium]
MNALVPNRFLFDFEFPLRYRPAPIVIDGDEGKWSDEELLPRLGEIDGREDFAEAWACWNETGLYFACRVTGRKRPLRCDPKGFWLGDNVRICTDMRDARSIKRATRACQQFFLTPIGGGASGKEPVAGVNKFKRARDDAPPIDPDEIEIASRVTKTAYTLEAHIPANCLSGFDPVDHPRIGFYYIIEDRDRGQQYLTVGDDLYWYVDPSTWASAVLAR